MFENHIMIANLKISWLLLNRRWFWATVKVSSSRQKDKEWMVEQEEWEGKMVGRGARGQWYSSGKRAKSCRGGRQGSRWYVHTCYK